MKEHQAYIEGCLRGLNKKKDQMPPCAICYIIHCVVCPSCLGIFVLKQDLLYDMLDYYIIRRQI